MASTCSDLENFVTESYQMASKLVLVTSGGTKVNLEQNTVRFIDNFSSGERGALSTERFLQNGYRVIFLSRTGSIMPFTKTVRRSFSKDIGFELLSNVAIANGLVQLVIDSSFEEEFNNYQRLKSNLFVASFSTVDEYLNELTSIAQLIDRIYITDQNDFRRYVLYYLAAAVSDFYLPPHKLSEHKIQSGTGLTLNLDPVPKLLPILTSTWAPKSYVVSFKLETDKNLVIEKATRAIQNYGVHSVVANQLQTRREVVHIVDSPAIQSLGENSFVQDNIRVTDVLRGSDEIIEPKIVDEICFRHDQFSRIEG